MASVTDEPTSPELDEEAPPPEPTSAPTTGGQTIGMMLLRIVGALAIPIAAFALLWLTFDFLRDADANRLLVIAVAIVVGVGGVFFLYWGMNRVVDLLPQSVSAKACAPTSSSGRRW